MNEEKIKNRKAIMLFSVGFHFAILFALFVLPFFKRKPKERELTSLNVKVDLSQLIPEKKSTPVKTEKPQEQKPSKKEKPEETKKNDENEIKEKANQLKQEAIKRAAEQLKAKQLKAKQLKAEADRKAAEKRAADKKKKAAAERKRLEDIKKRDAERRLAERKKREQEERLRKQRAALEEAKEKRAKAARAQAQQKIKSQYNTLLAADVRRQWQNQYLNRTGIDLQDCVKIQIKISRNGSVMSKKIIKLAKSTALNRAAKTFLAGLKSLPSFPKNMDAAYITETISLGIQ